MKFQAIKGVRDILPPDSALWNRVEQAAREVFATYGYGEIRLPIFEPTDLFARSIGAETDIVSKEMYTFEDHEEFQLAWLQSLILTGQLFAKIPEAATRANILLKFFQDALAAFEAGSIPRTPENSELLKYFQAQQQGIVGAIAAVKDDALRIYTDTLIQNARSLDLGQSLALRPEGTASTVRAYIEHGMQTLPSPVKLCYMGPMFRRERPQKGRYRQFYQIGAEVLGPNIAHYAVDAEVITMLMALFDRCGLRGHALYINSIGCKECRPKYVELLRIELRKISAQLRSDSQRRIETNPLRVLDSKLPEEQALIETLPKISENLCEDCRAHFDGLRGTLTGRGILFKVNPRLVRGLDYYIRTTFEVTAPGQGSQDAICGGGRYDGLVELIGGAKFRDIKGVGFAIGEDRLIDALTYEGMKARPHVDVLVAWKDSSSREHAEKIAQMLRLLGLAVEVPVKSMSPGEGLGLASKRQIPIGVVIGPDEVSAAVFSVRLLAEGEQVSVTQAQLDRARRLLKFRALLLRDLEETAIVYGLDYKGLTLSELVTKMIEVGALPGHLKLLIEMAMDTFNRLMHGEEVKPEHENEAVAASLRVLDELSGQGPKLRSRIDSGIGQL